MKISRTKYITAKPQLVDLHRDTSWERFKSSSPHRRIAASPHRPTWKTLRLPAGNSGLLRAKRASLTKFVGMSPHPSVVSQQARSRATTLPYPSTMEHSPHPFYPIEAEIVGYLANKWPVLTLLTIFGGGCALILGSTWAFVGHAHPNLSRADKFVILWFILSM